MSIINSVEKDVRIRYIDNQMIITERNGINLCLTDKAINKEYLTSKLKELNMEVIEGTIDTREKDCDKQQVLIKPEKGGLNENSFYNV